MDNLQSEMDMDRPVRTLSLARELELVDAYWRACNYRIDRPELSEWTWPY